MAASDSEQRPTPPPGHTVPVPGPPPGQSVANQPASTGAAPPVMDGGVADLPPASVVTQPLDLPAETDFPDVVTKTQDRPADPLPEASVPTEQMPSEEEPEEGSEHRYEDVADFAVKNAPPWLVSGLVHMLLMIILGIWFLGVPANRQVELESIFSEELGEQLELDTVLAGHEDEAVEEAAWTMDDLMTVDDPLANLPDLEISLPDAIFGSSDAMATMIGISLDGRDEGMKRALLAAYGGTATTEAAVLAGLKWLAKMQRPNGSWSLAGPYSDGSRNENETAATAMALLAFQGAGNTPTNGQFKSNVQRGWNWLLKQQDEDGNFFHVGKRNERFYTNGQSAIALCELYCMTKDTTYKEPAERAIDYLLRSQGYSGGWKYSPGVGSDVSVTGWVLMALQSARMAGIDVPKDKLRRVGEFLDSVAGMNGSRYAYESGDELSPAMTAEGLLCRQYLGWQQYDKRLIAGAEYLCEEENLISYYEDDYNVYYWYYATQVLHHMEGDYWKRWNAVMREEVPSHQVKEGREAGSWDPTQDKWGDFGGRLYVTCLSIYMLEVYYRHLPLYSNVYTTINGF